MKRLGVPDIRISMTVLRQKANSIMLVLYLHLEIILCMLSPIMDSKQLSVTQYAMEILLIVCALLVNNFRIGQKFLWILVISLTYMVTNLLCVSYRYFLLVEIISILLRASLPFYVVMMGKVNYEYLMRFWYRMALALTLLLPVYSLLYRMSFIGYADIGRYARLNAMIFAYCLFAVGEVGVATFLAWGLNIGVGLIMGSRMSFTSSLMAAIATMLLLRKERNSRYYMCLVAGGILALTIGCNIRTVLTSINAIADRHGIHSRNLYLFVKQLEGAQFEELDSGRGKIYEVVSRYIKQRLGLPGGLAVPRYLTGGAYYCSHNVILDFFLVFGVIGSVIFLVWYVHKMSRLWRTRAQNYHKVSLYVILAVSFWFASLTGAYFLVDKFFLLSTAVLLSGDYQSEIHDGSEI